MKKAFFPAVLLAALLTGCGTPAPSPAATSAPTAETTARFDCDAVFFGDSITADGDFADWFPEKTVVNLGVYGDTLEDLRRRVPAVRAAKPERIFLLGGINCLRDDNSDQCLRQYEDLLDALRTACPDSSLIIQSVLPVSEELAPMLCSNETIRRFNAALEALAEKEGCGFVDLWTVYAVNGALDPAQTRDGLHLNFNAYGPWAEAVRAYLED